MEISEFISIYPIFTFEQFKQNCFPNANPDTIYRALNRLQKRNKTRILKKSLYQSRPPGVSGFPPPSPILVASQLTKDAVLSHQSAFDALGFSHSEFFGRATFFTNSKRHEIKIEGVTYKPLIHPKALREAGKVNEGVIEQTIGSLIVRSTTRERTLVDGIQSLKWAGGWEEYCHCVDKIPSFDWKKVWTYSKLLNKTALFNRLGFFLEENQERLFVPSDLITQIHKNISDTEIILEKGLRKGFQKNKKWKVLIPEGAIIKLKELS